MCLPDWVCFPYLVSAAYKRCIFIFACKHNILSPSWELWTASPRGRYGECRQHDPCLKHTYKNKTCWPALTARLQYKGRRENTSSTSFVFTDCFVWSMHSGKSTVFYLLSWRALVRRLRSVWIRVLAIWHPMNTHNLCVFCLGEENARDVLEGETFFYEKAPLQSVPLF